MGRSSPSMCVGQGVLERRHLRWCPDRDPQPSVGAGLADQHAPVEQPLPDARAGRRTDRTARSSRRCRRPRGPAPRSQSTVRSRSARSSSTWPSSSSACRSAASATAWVTAREVVGQPDHAQRVADAGCRGEVAEPGAGQRERLAHRAGHDEVAVLRQQLERGRGAGAAELGVRLVDRRRRRRRAVAHGLRSTVVRQRRAGRVVRARAAGPRSAGARSTSRRGATSRSKLKSSRRGGPSTQAGHRVAGVLRVHRVRRREASAVRPGPPKACSSCSITSLEPLAAHTCSGATLDPGVGTR